MIFCDIADENMAPSQSQIVTFAAGSALFVGIIYTIYLVRSRKDKRQDSASSKKNGDTQESKYANSEPFTQDAEDANAEPDIKQKDPNLASTSQSAGKVQTLRSESFVAPSDDEVGDSPLPDKEGLTVSASWAILHSSNQSSPQLSPVNSEASIVDGAGDGNCISLNGVDDDSFNDAGDDTHTNTMLEGQGDQCTVLEEQGDQSSVLAEKGDQSSFLEEKGDQSSVLEEKGDQSSVLERHGNQSAVLKEQGDQSSVLEEKGDQSSVLEAQDDQSSALEEKGDQSSVLEENGDQSSALEERGRMQRQLSMTSYEVSHVENITVEYEELLREHRESESQTFTREEITEALLATQSPELGLTERNAQVLTGLLTFKDLHLKYAAVQGIAKCAAFTNNQNVLREKGVIPRLTKLLELQRMSLWLRHDNAASAISTTIQAVTNMAINPVNNAQMEGCVQTLVDVTLDRDTGTPIRLSSLQALTNLSAVENHHTHYTRAVQGLYDYLALKDTALKTQALKILVNLSCNPEMVPHLLAAKAPENLPQFIDAESTEEGILLRFVTLLANILQVVRDRNLKSSDLPSVDKAASPETMYSALLGIGAMARLKNKMFLLCKHSNTEIRQQAAKVYNHLK
ncbi:uncharacterized protein LOC127881942 isoform X2 [Dreissena polymorpha]|uniref:uncharacterized protein LOC127881942 isoform X2 n=1 Tax=Dreissena polymorpha TaxID=45954 RepID=UPI0022640D4D|nr:uncharacterized protein LOC127881942 isoform X2 [Dreissena polymorpha]